MKRSFFLLYGVVAYGAFVATFLYLIGFVEDVVVRAASIREDPPHR
jgi:hypothetical protein